MRLTKILFGKDCIYLKKNFSDLFLLDFYRIKHGNTKICLEMPKLEIQTVTYRKMQFSSLVNIYAPEKS